MEARRGSGGIAPPHPQPGIRMGWLVSTMLPERPGTHYPAGLVGIGAGLDGTKKFAPLPLGFFFKLETVYYSTR